MTIHLLKGPGKTEGDSPLFQDLYVSQDARAYLENLQESRKQGEESKTLLREVIEERLKAIARAKGEDGLNALRDRAREISSELEMEKELKN